VSVSIGRFRAAYVFLFRSIFTGKILPILSGVILPAFLMTVRPSNQTVTACWTNCLMARYDATFDTAQQAYGTDALQQL
jgi:hypothetical protein